MRDYAAHKRKFAEHWQEITESPNPLKEIADRVAKAARTAFDESKQLIIEEHLVELERLPRAFEGLRVVQLSDIHHSPFTDAEQIRRSVEIANALEPDVMVLTGDYVSHETEYIAPVAEILGELRAPYGTFAILGNHDHWTDARLITDLLRAENITVLINEGFRFEIGGESIWFCGVDDTTVGLADLDLALAGGRENEFKFLLCHNPAILRRAAKARVDFILSGHTHGGQVRLRQKTENLILPLRPRNASGLLRRGATQIYISRGIGMVVLPVRYGCPPEITLLELRRANRF
jgi:uncharacterized protein